MTRLGQLKKSLEILSASGKHQIAYLRGLNNEFSEVDENYVIDEIVLEFEDIALAANDMFSHGEITSSQRDAICSLNEYLSSFSVNQPKSIWTSASLQKAPEWEKIRIMACKCLSLLNGNSRR